MAYSVQVSWLELRQSADNFPKTATQRALIMVSGKTEQFKDTQLSQNRKVLVLENGTLKQRVTLEGAPVVIKNGMLTTLANNESLVF